MLKINDEVQTAVEEEKMKRQQILDENDKFQQLWFKHKKMPECSTLEDFANNPPTLEFISEKSRFMQSFVKARTLTSLVTTDVVLPKKVGKAPDAKKVLDILAQNPHHKLDKDQDTWVLRAYQQRTAKQLTLTMAVEVPEPLLDPPLNSNAIDIEEGTQVSPASNQTIIVAAPHQHPKCLHSIFTSPEKVKEIKKCFVGCIISTFITANKKRNSEILCQKVSARFKHHKDFRMKGKKHLENHWALTAFEENIPVLSEIVVLTNQVSNVIGRIKYDECMLRPMNLGVFQPALSDANKMLQGVYLFYDRERATFVLSRQVDGKEGKNFQTAYDENAKRAKNGTSLFCRKYPHIISPLGGEAVGCFGDLDMIVGVGVNPTHDNDCLIRAVDGVFFWSERTMAKINEIKISDYDLKTKQIKFVTYMLSLFYELMLGLNSNASDGPGVDAFMGGHSLA